MPKPKKSPYDREIFCPHCEQPVHVKFERHTVVPAQPAETEIRVIVEKGGKEARLDDSETSAEA